MSRGTDISDRIIHGLIFDLALNAANAYILAEVPFLNLPIIRQVYLFLMGKIAGVFEEQLQQFAAFKIIDFKTEKQARDYEAAVSALKEATHPKEGAPDAKRIEEAKEAMRARLRDLIRIEH